MTTSNVIWSTEKPTEIGWYLLKDEQLDIVCKIQVNIPDILPDGYLWSKIEEQDLDEV